MGDKFHMDGNNDPVEAIRRKKLEAKLALGYVANRNLSLLISDEFASVDGKVWWNSKPTAESDSAGQYE
jgi:hypothetical protein